MATKAEEQLKLYEKRQKEKKFKEKRKRKKTIRKAIFILVSITIFSLIRVSNHVSRHYEYLNTYEYSWNLADKSSNLNDKHKHINDLIVNIETNRDHFADNSNYFYMTKDTDFDLNLKALITLRDRLEEISKMDISSFEYQLAIQQITEQEQGEATNMLNVIKGSWMKGHYYFHSHLAFILSALAIQIFFIILGIVGLLDD